MSVKPINCLISKFDGNVLTQNPQTIKTLTNSTSSLFLLHPSSPMDSDYGIPRQLSDLQKIRSLYQPDLPPCLQVISLLPFLLLFVFMQSTTAVTHIHSSDPIFSSSLFSLPPPTSQISLIPCLFFIFLLFYFISILLLSCCQMIPIIPAFSFLLLRTYYFLLPDLLFNRRFY